MDTEEYCEHSGVKLDPKPSNEYIPKDIFFSPDDFAMLADEKPYHIASMAACIANTKLRKHLEIPRRCEMVKYTLPSLCWQAYNTSTPKSSLWARILKKLEHWFNIGE